MATEFMLRKRSIHGSENVLTRKRFSADLGSRPEKNVWQILGPNSAGPVCIAPTATPLTPMARYSLFVLKVQLNTN